VMLRGGIPRDGPAHLVGFLRGQSSPKAGNNIEFAESLAPKERRRNRGIRTAVTMTAGGDGRAKLRTQHIVSLLFIAGEKPVLVKKSHISETVFHFGRVVLHIRRVVKIEFAIEAGNQVQPAACSVIPGRSERRSNLTKEVGAKNLDQHGIGRDERRRPRRLLSLNRGGSRFPFGK